MGYDFDMLQGGGGMAAGAMMGSAIGPLGVVGGAILGALGGLGKAPESTMSKELLEALNRSRGTQIAAARRGAGRAKAGAQQTMVSRGLSNTTAAIGANTAVDEALGNELARINSQIDLAIASSSGQIQYEGSPFSGALRAFGQYAAQYEKPDVTPEPDIGPSPGFGASPFSFQGGLGPLAKPLSTGFGPSAFSWQQPQSLSPFSMAGR